MILLLDNYDSFTYNLVDYFAQLGLTCDIKRNDITLSEITRQQYQGVVISPGPQEPFKAGVLMEVLGYYAEKLPILGICLGHQAIGQYFGGRLVKATRPMHGKISKIRCEDHPLYKHIPKKHAVVRYNSLLIAYVERSLKVVAKTTGNEVMAIAHNKMPVWGVQYHPEAILSQYGIQTLKNWVEVNEVVTNN